LISKYKYIRRTRGDGNCFYRAFGFGYLEENLRQSKELDRFRQLALDLKNQLVKLGYLDFTVEDVRDAVRKNSMIDMLCHGLGSGTRSDR
jgi:ubiquitin thioesterase protein OTUB1